MVFVSGRWGKMGDLEFGLHPVEKVIFDAVGAGSE